jgi:hypothetical protein
MCQRELLEKKEEEKQDCWFNRLWPMTKPKQTSQEKWLAKEEGDSRVTTAGGGEQGYPNQRGRQPKIE